MTSINFEPVEVEKLTRLQKLAIFLISIGSEAAGELLRNFDDPEIEAVCRQIAVIKIVDEELQEAVRKEFIGIIAKSFESTLGGMLYAQKTLELAKKDLKSLRSLNQNTKKENASELIQEIADMESRQMYNLMKNENEQTIAFLLSHLATKKCADIITMLNAEQRENVVEKLGLMESTTNTVVSKVVNALKKHLHAGDQDIQNKSGGVRQVADVMNALNKEVSKNILSKLEQKNQQLGNAIRKKMFGFDDLLKLSVKDMQRIARDVEMSDLVVALKGAKPPLQEAIFKSVSKRAAQTLKDEMQMMGAVKLKEIEFSQDRIIQVVRRLEEEGEITIELGGGDENGSS